MRNHCICVSVPHHITAFFVPRYTGDLRTSGSYGAGVIVGPEGTVCLGEGERPTRDPLREVALELGISNARFKLKDPLPYGMGYASSAVMAIGGSIAIAYSLGLPLNRALEVSHISEIKSRTGLGDVQAIASSSLGEGIVVRIEPGAPHLGRIEVILMPRTVSMLSLELGKMNTQELLNTYGVEEAKEASFSLKKLMEDPSFENFINLSTNYTKKLSLLRRLFDYPSLEQKVEKTPGLVGYYVKKRIVVMFVERDMVGDAIGYLLNNKLKVRVLESKTTGITIQERRC